MMPKRIRVATWNIDWCPLSGARSTDFKKRIKKANADVWILTETRLGFSPGEDYKLISHSEAATDLDVSKGKCWVSIWSRLLPAEKVTLTADLERCAAAKVATSLYVVGTVLPWHRDPRPKDSTWLDHYESRLKQQLFDWCRLGSESGMGLCLSGDFNQDLLGTGSYYGPRGGREVLRKALDHAKLECLTAGANDPLAMVKGLGSIDHLCVRGLQEVAPCKVFPEAGTLPQKLKEHYGVWVDLTVEEHSP